MERNGCVDGQIQTHTHTFTHTNTHTWQNTRDVNTQARFIVRCFLPNATYYSTMDSLSLRVVGWFFLSLYLPLSRCLSFSCSHNSFWGYSEFHFICNHDFHWMFMHMNTLWDATWIILYIVQRSKHQTNLNHDQFYSRSVSLRVRFFSLSNQFCIITCELHSNYNENEWKNWYKSIWLDFIY